MGFGVVDGMDCTKIGFTVYQQEEQWLMVAFGVPGAIPVDPDSPLPYLRVRVAASWNSTFTECNTNSSGAFITKAIVVTKSELPFYFEVSYQDPVTLNWSSACRIPVEVP